jgi:hypothetical protein
MQPLRGMLTISLSISETGSFLTGSIGFHTFRKFRMIKKAEIVNTLRLAASYGTQPDFSGKSGSQLILF